MAGTCEGHEELAAAAIELEAGLPVVPARGGEELVRRLFEPLGYKLDVTPIALDPQVADWGDSRHLALTVRGREYLRIIYGTEYADPSQIDRLRRRSLGRKRSLAVREFARGGEALERFVRREPLHRVHECVFAVPAMESEPVDSRL
jgi:hypothetical protein